ncbi:uncharacterized protein PG998_014582 [Apiospora kogelbergensis]|uniref:uncharacterized protein n=1 Tax=Apiospora kogelbergensis TaxID=1337665 RepID=UPI0031324D86
MDSQRRGGGQTQEGRRLKVLISGAGIAGSCTAFWLAKFGCDVTIVERSSALRATGQQIDLRGQAIVIMKMMGIEPEIQAAKCHEPGTMTTDWEIMRGDLVTILYDATKDLEGVKYVFGREIASFTQDEGSARAKVHVTFSDGGHEDYDMLIGADGIGSSTRKKMLGSEFPDPLHDMGDTDDWNICLTANGETLMTRQDQRGLLRVYLFSRGPCGALDRTRTVSELKAAVAARFRASTAWETPRFVRELLAAPEADDLYSQHQSQIRLPAGMWSRGRVALVGDAGYCTTVGGVGVTVAFAGAYVLAGEVKRRWEAELRDPGSFNLQPAMSEYERWLRPLINSHQGSQKVFFRMMFPRNVVELWLVQGVIALITFLRLDKALFNWVRAEGPHRLEYPDYFGWLPLLKKRAYGREIEGFMKSHVNHITKAEFLVAFQAAFSKVFTPDKVKAGFRGAGIVPLDPDRVISKLDVKLSTPSPTRSLPAATIPWASQTPHNPTEATSQTDFIKS